MHEGTWHQIDMLAIGERFSIGRQSIGHGSDLRCEPLGTLTVEDLPEWLRDRTGARLVRAEDVVLVNLGATVNGLPLAVRSRLYACGADAVQLVFFVFEDTHIDPRAATFVRTTTPEEARRLTAEGLPALMRYETVYHLRHDRNVDTRRYVVVKALFRHDHTQAARQTNVLRMPRARH